MLKRLKYSSEKANKEEFTEENKLFIQIINYCLNIENQEIEKSNNNIIYAQYYGESMRNTGFEGCIKDIMKNNLSFTEGKKSIDEQIEEMIKRNKAIYNKGEEEFNRRIERLKKYNEEEVKEGIGIEKISQWMTREIEEEKKDIFNNVIKPYLLDSSRGGIRAKKIKNKDKFLTFLDKEVQEHFNKKKFDLVKRIKYKFLSNIGLTLDDDKYCRSKGAVKNIDTILYDLYNELSSDLTLDNNYIDEIYNKTLKYIENKYGDCSNVKNDMANLKKGDTIVCTLPLWKDNVKRDGCFVIINGKFVADANEVHRHLVRDMVDDDIVEAEQKEISEFGISNTEIREMGKDKSKISPMEIMENERVGEGHYLRKIFGYIYEQDDKYFAIIDGRSATNYYWTDAVNILKKQSFNGQAFSGILVVDEADGNKMTRVANNRLRRLRKLSEKIYITRVM